MKEETTDARWIALKAGLHAAIGEAYLPFCLENKCGYSDYSEDWTAEHQAAWDAEMDRITARWKEFEQGELSETEWRRETLCSAFSLDPLHEESWPADTAQIWDQVRHSVQHNWDVERANFRDRLVGKPTVRQLVEKLVAGEMTTEQVAAALSQKKFRVAVRGPADENDARAYDDDSFAVVGHAYNMGRLTDEQYDRLGAAFGAG
ncbi:hypothetical protein [Antrihabitans stalactiti]|uniref:Uncharacterized protein n=1 Tax=Antrihabitans stalactiti TaxID=2584121 RepID=A0A848K8N5_9NOCA|nr:hypothetical protein [Antrihabitans stalactiti]NMN94811.1 hypothetical protein [Antrihabitans stalactiti]